MKLKLKVAYQAKRTEQRLVVMVVQTSGSKNLGSNFEKSRRELEKNYGCNMKGQREVVSVHKGLADNCWHLGSRLDRDQDVVCMNRTVLMVYAREVAEKEIDVEWAVVVLEGPEGSKEMQTIRERASFKKKYVLTSYPLDGIRRGADISYGLDMTPMILAQD